jgi:hypothetical protein
MPIIASQHKNEAWRPLLAWPDDALVQWGGSGVVLAGRESYQTAFFEVFPKDGSAGFLRGEGVDLEAAESSAHKAWTRQNACHTASGHRWSRAMRNKDGGVSTYTNGGCFCLRCGSFQTAMAPIVELGAWRKPLGVSEIDHIASGFCRPSKNLDAIGRKWLRTLALRAALSGIKLPPITPREPGLGPFAQDSYQRACERAVALFYIANRDLLESNGADDEMSGLLDGFAIKRLKRIAETLLQEQCDLDPESAPITEVETTVLVLPSR